MRYSDIHATLVEARRSAGLSSTEVARRQDISRQLFSNREAGRSRADVDQLKEWAQAVGLDLVVDLVPAGGRSNVVELSNDAAALSGDDRATVAALARALREADPKTARRVRRYIQSVAEELQEERRGRSLG